MSLDGESSSALSDFRSTGPFLLRSEPRILLDARFRHNPMGGDRCKFELAHRFDASNADVKSGKFWFLVYEETQDTLQTDHKVEAKYFPDQHPQFDYFEHVEIPQHCRALDVDIYHGTFNVLPIRKAGKVNIVTIHDMAVFAFPQAYSKKFVPYMRFLIQRSVALADRIITVSETTKNELLKYIPNVAAPIMPILNGVGEEFVAASGLSDIEVSKIRQKYKIDSPFVLFVGNLEQKKNLPRLIQAFDRLKKDQNLPHKLLVAGRPLQKGPTELFSKAPSGIVRFLDYIEKDDLPKLYRAADLVAYPSLYEGFGLPVIEGMACGIPVLTSTASCLPETAGGAALLVDPHDIDAMAKQLFIGLTDQGLRHKLIDLGLERAKQLNWDANAKATLNVYEQVWSEQKNFEH